MTLRAERMRAWSDFLRRVRTYLEKQNITEISTNYIVEAGAMESSLDCLKVSWKTGAGELHSSPEFEMKHALGDMQSPIYQICKCFRDDPHTPIHRREFHMLEVYLPGVSSDDLAQWTADFFTAMAGKPLSFKRRSISELFAEQVKLDLDRLGDVEAFRAAVENCGVRLDPSDQWDDIFFKVMLERIEPTFEPETPLIVHAYPASQGVLSVLDSQGRAERFEIYWKGMELCNGCNELTDPQELSRRLEFENEKRSKEGKPTHPTPQRLIEAVKRMPPASGVAIGLDRLFRATSGFDLP